MDVRVFSSSHLWMWDYTEGWALKNWCFWTVVLEKILESPLGSKEIKPVSPKGNQPWISLEGLMLKLKLQYFGHLMQRADSLEMTWKSWERLKAKGKGGDRGWDGWWQHGLNGHEFEQTPRDSEGQGNLVCCSPLGSQRVRHNWETEQQPNNRNLLRGWGSRP